MRYKCVKIKNLLFFKARLNANFNLFFEFPIIKGAFLIPFLISSIVVGIPYVILEVSLGQWMKEGGIGAWNLTPLFKGIYLDNFK